MSRIRDLAKILTASTDMATDAEVTSSIASHAAAADPHTVYLKESEYWAAGKNKIINGDFAINQRGFSSITCSGSPQYGFDRFSATSNTGTVTMSAQTFTPGTAPVAGYEAKNFVRIDSTGQSGTSAYSILYQPIEDVRTFANQTITVSFWAKASSGTPSIALEIAQGFGSGGSPSAQVNTAGGKVAITTSWARYSFTVAVPSISGKIIGTTHPGVTSINFWTSAGTDFNTRASSLGIQTNAIDFWGIQAEVGSVATPFTTATGNPASELAACQRYYLRHSYSGTNSGLIGPAYARTTGIAFATWTFPVTMRATPTLAFSNATQYFNLQIAAGDATFNTLSGSSVANTDRASLRADAGTHTIGQAGVLSFNNSAAWIEASAEL